MTIIKRAVNIVRSNRKLQAIKYPGSKVLKELRKHESDLSRRLDAIEFADYILNLESTRWKAIVSLAEDKQPVANEKQQILAERLVLLSRATEEKYSERKQAMGETIKALQDTLSRVENSIMMMETDQDLRALSNMLSLDNFGSTSFDIHAESRGIKNLLHTADALLELIS
jgi:hypothetical protein